MTISLILGAIAAAATAATPTTARSLGMNDIQVVGTHNSYKQSLSPPLHAALAARDPKLADALDYGHRPLAEQLDHGARTLELDVNYDPKGGYYDDGRHDPELMTPGFKVLHMAFSDSATSCKHLTQCLREIVAWSAAHPDHVPIMLMFNAKEAADDAHGKPALRFTETAFDALDAEIRSVVPRTMLILPDDVQGHYPTLRDAVLAGNWPTLDAARGKVFFAMDEPAAKVAIYRGRRRSLEGRVFFINTDEESPAAAYLTINDPIAEAQRIRRDVAAGFIVRTRADADTWEARRGDLSRYRAALTSGAQYISTDYLFEDARLPGYHITLPEGAIARCNPVRTKAGCPAPLEHQPRLTIPR